MQRAGGRFKPRPRWMSLKDEPKWRRATLLPTPPCKIILRDTHLNRLTEHYHHTLKEDLMILTYHHQLPGRPLPTKREVRLQYDPDNPYTKGRLNTPVGGATHTGIARKPMPPMTSKSIVSLESIHLHTFIRGAVSDRDKLTPMYMALRSLSGESLQGGGYHTAKGVELIRGIKTEMGWIRKGQFCGVKVELKGEKMYDFLSQLVTFVLPRIKDFPGFELPSPREGHYRPHQASGVVSFGLTPNQLSLFPQLEVNIDSYPQIEGMHVHCATNARGLGAQMQARQLLSAFNIPFMRK